MLDLINTFIHLYCLCFLLRVIFQDQLEVFFNPALHFVRRVTDPVLLFFKNNQILRNPLNPWIPILLLLLLKPVLLKSTLTNVASIQLNYAFLLSFLEFLSFLFKFYIILFWIIFAAAKFGFYDDIFNLMSNIVDKTLSLFRFIAKGFHVRTDRFRSFLFLNFIFLLLNTSVYLLILYLNRESVSFLSLMIIPLKLMGKNYFEMISLLPFLLFIRIIISWFMPPDTKVLLLLHAVTEPVLAPFRKLNLVIGVMDFSPILAFFVLQIIISFLHQLLSSIP